MFVLLILSICTKPQITFAVVEAVMVFMVAHQAFRHPQNFSMHFNSSTIFTSTCVETISIFTRTPFVLVKPIVIFGVYNCELALR